jgi:small subunit ribosomal protein S20
VPNSKQGNKAARAAERKRLQNRLVRRGVKTHVAKAKSAVDDGEESAYQKTMMAISSVDKAVSKGVIHRNKGARLKSLLKRNLDKGQGATS